MSGLHVHISNRMEIMAQKLARIVRTPPPSALTPEIVLVQRRGMERWVSMALAEHNGICFSFRAGSPIYSINSGFQLSVFSICPRFIYRHSLGY